MSVLLVEDNVMIAMNTETLLIDLGVGRVETAGSVAAAFALIDGMKFDFAILDVNLGGEDSLPIAERLGSDGVPFAFATGFGEELVLPDRHAGVAILKKPYSYEDLRGLLGGD